MAGGGRKSADDALAAALAAGQTLRDAATAAGVSERTAARRAADPAFQRRVEALRAELVSAALGRLAALLSDATDALKRAVSCGKVATEVKAATAIFQQLLKVRDQTIPEERLAAIEEQLRQVKGSNG